MAAQVVVTRCQLSAAFGSARAAEHPLFCLPPSGSLYARCRYRLMPRASAAAPRTRDDRSVGTAGARRHGRRSRSGRRGRRPRRRSSNASGSTERSPRSHASAAPGAATARLALGSTGSAACFCRNHRSGRRRCLHARRPPLHYSQRTPLPPLPCPTVANAALQPADAARRFWRPLRRSPSVLWSGSSKGRSRRASTTSSAGAHREGLAEAPRTSTTTHETTMIPPPKQ